MAIHIQHLHTQFSSWRLSNIQDAQVVHKVGPGYSKQRADHTLAPRYSSELPRWSQSLFLLSWSMFLGQKILFHLNCLNKPQQFSLRLLFKRTIYFPSGACNWGTTLCCLHPLTTMLGVPFPSQKKQRPYSFNWSQTDLKNCVFYCCGL